MNNQTHSKPMETMIGFLLVLFAVLLLSACSSRAQADEPSCTVDMDMHVTIDATDVKPRVVFDQLASNPDCAITISPFVRKHVTLHVQNETVTEVVVSVCQQIDCKYILNKDHLTIRPYTILDRWQAQRGEAFNKYMAERRKILQSRLPDGMTFEDVPLSAVLEEISKASGLTIRPWKDEGDRKVTIDVSGMTVDDALKAVVLYVDGEGAVLIEQKYFLHHSWGQHWLWGYPPNP